MPPALPDDLTVAYLRRFRGRCSSSGEYGALHDVASHNRCQYSDALCAMLGMPDHCCVWSPDGRWISYDRDDTGPGPNGAGCCSMSLRLIHPDGSDDHAVTLMHDPIHDAPAAVVWSPDGHRFAFSTDAFDPRDPALALVDTRSGRITSVRVPNALPLGWSRDGRELAIVQGSSSGQPDSLSLIGPSGRSRTLATALPPARAGAWSPDGTRLAIAVSPASVEKGVRRIGAVELEAIDPAGGPSRAIAQLARGSQVDVVAWRPRTTA